MLLATAPQELTHVLTDRTWVTPVIAELTLEPVDAPLPFLPGQYALVSDTDFRIPVRSYSLANAPDPGGRLSLLVTRVPGGTTSEWLTDGLPVGEQLLVDGPYGTFVVDPSLDQPVLGLAGGSGLAPILALAEDAVRRGMPHPFTVVFSCRTEEHLIHADRLLSWAEEYADFSFVRTLTQAEGPPPVGRVQTVLPQLVPDLSGHGVFIAGAPGFVAAGVQVARELGCCPGALHTEEFYAEPQPWS